MANIQDYITPSLEILVDDGTIKIRNLSTTSEISVVIKLNNKNTVKSISIDKESEFIFKPSSDGIFYFYVDNELKIKILYNLYNIKLFIKRFKQILCNCSCTDCYEINRDRYENLAHLALLAAHLQTTSMYPTLYFEMYLKYNINIFKEEICKPEAVINNGENKEEFNEQYISGLKFKLLLDYATTYKALLIEGFSEEYLNKLFSIEEVNCCYSKYGLDFNNIIKNDLNMAILNINFQAKPNNPPTVTGTNITRENRTGIILSRAILIDNAGYSDPEGDAPDAIKITDLVLNGSRIELNGNPVAVGDIIPMTEIDNGNLTLLAPDTDSLATVQVKYVVRDVGSMQWSSSS